MTDASADPARPVALVANATTYVGPSLARELARRGHDLVIGDPADGLVTELEQLGATVVTVEGTRDLSDPENAQRLVAAGIDRFGRIDAATAFTGDIVLGTLLDTTLDQVQQLERGLIEAPYHFLQAVLPPMIDAGGGQVLVLTSSAGARTVPGAAMYSALRAGATHLVRNVAREVAKHRVQVNALGTNFMDFPGFLKANRATDADGRARVESRVPMGRLGSVDECAALCAAYLDGSCGFVTGQFVAHDGGWSSS